MNVIKWIGRKLFYTESLKDRQERKLGTINEDTARLHNNDELPILNKEPDGHYVIPTVMGFIEPPPKRKGKKKTRNKKSCIK